ncbi:MAG: MoxR family ATPase [Chloroflexi bacterium]|jgi:MoxR-like ATPase|nr:MoxR family ATPase [Chloroflexota bacterium]MBT3670915.1 MoxR family ATPase [Chloroflexota bacterium]MBT4002744.1 MoxR family ATPase [Chloroflexota bacterium]MBT4306371.1 MoxR family ATPase [Chloroflexota bacterium]MBT4532748.1 MoxR family ATPase [Chloroflexota bacterium]
MTDVQEFSEKIIKNIEKVIIGKRNAIEKVVINLLGQGHLLIEDVPGTGKTMLARSLATSIGGSFNRIQFTPDMLPSDVTGVSIFNQVSREFEFRPGPIMAQVVLADEINRATPKTQAALLEAMSEQQITVDGITHKLPNPFMVLATQNPIEYEGTFPLPEAQLDRFFMRARIGYPDFDAEMSVLNSQQFKHPLEDLQTVASVDEALKMQAKVREVHVADSMRYYIVDLTRKTRNHTDSYLGASTRGSLALFRASQAKAALEGRDYVLPDDVKGLAQACLAHRVILGPAARLRDVTSDALVDEIIKSVPVPGGDLTPD